MRQKLLQESSRQLNDLDKYLLVLMRCIHCGRKEKKDIYQELQSHLQEVYTIYIGQGKDTGEAEKLTIFDMGNIYDIAEGYNRLFRQKRLFRRKILATMLSAFLIIIATGSTIYIRQMISINNQKYDCFYDAVEKGLVDLKLTQDDIDAFYTRTYDKDSIIATAIDLFYRESKNRRIDMMDVTPFWIFYGGKDE